MALKLTANVTCDLCGKKGEMSSQSEVIMQVPEEWAVVVVSVATGAIHEHPPGEKCPHQATNHVCPRCIVRVRRALMFVGEVA